MASFQEKWFDVDDTIFDRGIYMFNNELLSDVSLVVPASRQEGEPTAKKTKMAIPAHKFVLSMCSPVFFAMFCGKMSSSQRTLRSKSVDLPDCEYEGVLETLRYMYGGEARLNEGNVMQVLYVAKKYIVKSLAYECLNFLHCNLNPENVLCILSHAEQYDEKVLVGQCWEVIDRETDQVVTSEEFASIQKTLLEAIVKRDTLVVKEAELFKAVNLWATKECERQGLTPDGSVKRRILGETIVQQIRFPVMEQKEFASVVLDSEMLTPSEQVNMMKHFSSVLTTPLGFHGDKRAGALQSCFMFGHVSPVNSLSTKECLHLSVDKDIVLHGVRLFGSENNDYQATVTVKDEVNGVTIVKTSGKFSSKLAYKKNFCYDAFDVMFDQVNLSKHHLYSIEANINGPKSCTGYNGASEVTSHGVKFAFKTYESIPGYSWDCVYDPCAQFADIWFKLP